jgi:hypothetical protein
MKRLCLGVVIAAGLTLPAFGQAQSLRDQLVGAWELVSTPIDVDAIPRPMTRYRGWPESIAATLRHETAWNSRPQ